MMWALIINGAVFELTAINPAGRFAPGMNWVAVPNGTTVAVGYLYANGAFSAPPSPPAPSLAQLAAAAIFAGYTISLSGSLTLAATLFPTDPATQAKLASVMTTVNTTGDFPGGATSYPMKDASGAWHTFTLAQYKAVAAAIAAYVAQLDLIVDGNPMSVSALPASSAALTV